MGLIIDHLLPGDWPSVQRIYSEGISSGNATFELETHSAEEWDRSHLPFCRLAAREHGAIAGWAALSPVSSRAAYRGVAEVSVYVAANHRGRGVGKALLEALIAESRQNGIWTLQAGIFPENLASITLHLKCGFRVVGVRERIGFLRERWRDVVLLELRQETDAPP